MEVSIIFFIKNCFKTTKQSPIEKSIKSTQILSEFSIIYLYLHNNNINSIKISNNNKRIFLLLYVPVQQCMGIPAVSRDGVPRGSLGVSKTPQYASVQACTNGKK